MKAFFQRLEVYTQAAPSQEMLETITNILVEVLNFIGIVTKEIKQNRISKCFIYKSSPLTVPFSVKYLKKLIGRTDIEKAMRKLVRLTEEEGLMTNAQFLRTTKKIEDSVWGIEGGVHGIDNRVAVMNDRMVGVDERVAGVGRRATDINERVAGVSAHVSSIDGRVKDVGDKMETVNDKLVAVIDGAQQTADRVGRIERSWFPNRIHTGHAG